MSEGLHPSIRRWGGGTILLLAFGLLAAIGPVSSAGAAVTQSPPASVAQALEAAGGEGSALSDPLQYGVGNAPLAGFPTAGGTFGVLSSGDVTIADTPNIEEGSSTDHGVMDAARGNARDPVTLRADFVVPQGQTCLQIDYKFLSEEFPEFVNAGFNDGFVAELDGTSWSITQDPETFQDRISAPNDFAAGYGDQVAVDTVGPTIVSPEAAAGTTYDAATATLTAKAPITAGPHSVYLSIFDAGDGIYDSAVFLDNLRFTADPPENCRPPDLFNGAVGVDPTAGAIKFKGNTGSIALLCQLPAESTDPCVGNGVATASTGGNKRVVARAKSNGHSKGRIGPIGS